MPNHVENFLTIQGKKSEIQEVLDFIKTDYGALDFNTLIPYPEEYTKLDKIAEQWAKENKGKPFDKENPPPQDGYNQGGYHWCAANWGTKWNAYSIAGPCWKNESETGEYAENWAEAHIIFQTAWSPPEPVFKALAEKFPELEFTLNYFEQGGAFSGELHSQKAEYYDAEEGEKITCYKDNNYQGHRGG